MGQLGKRSEYFYRFAQEIKKLSVKPTYTKRVVLMGSRGYSIVYLLIRGNKMPKSKPTFCEALALLKTTRVLTTNLLEPLNISFEFFLRLAQLSDTREEIVIAGLIDMLEQKQETRRQK